MSWGPWIEHDGRGCPCPGSYVMAEFVSPIDGQPRGYGEGIANNLKESSWHWGLNGCSDVSRYRIRKPRGMEVLESILEQPERELEAAE